MVRKKVEEETFCRGERKLVLGDKNLKKIKEHLVSKKNKPDREGRTSEELYARSAKTLLLYRGALCCCRPPSQCLLLRALHYQSPS